MHKEYILFKGFRKAKKGFTTGFHVPLNSRRTFKTDDDPCMYPALDYD